MKYIKLFENFDSYDPYELMIVPPNKKAEIIVKECRKFEPNLNLVGDLIALGANLDWQDEENDGWTPLHVATFNGKTEIVRMLIGAGAKLDILDEDGCTPLHLATRRGIVEIVKILVDAGARTDIQANNGKTPYELATTQKMKNIIRP